MRSKETAIERCSTKVFVLQKAILQCICGEKPLKICIKEFIFSKIGSAHLATLLKKRFPSLFYFQIFDHKWRTPIFWTPTDGCFCFFVLAPVFCFIKTQYCVIHKKTVVLVRPYMCKVSENIIKDCIYEQITSSSSYIYLYERDWQEFMTYRYKTRNRLYLNTGDMTGHMYDKAHAQQQQQKRIFTQTPHRTKIPLPTPITKKLKSYIQKEYLIISIMP